MSVQDTSIARRSFMKTLIGTGATLGAVGAANALSQTETDRLDDPLDWLDSNCAEVPQRLSPVTRDLAQRALSGEHGRAMVAFPNPVTGKDTRGMTPNQAYALAARRVAEQAPLRLLPGEKIVGSATLLEAAMHQTPGLNCLSTSHTTLGFHKILELGYSGLRKKIQERLARGGFEHRQPQSVPDTQPPECPGEDLLNAMLGCLDAAEIWQQRYRQLLAERIAGSQGEEQATYREVLAVLQRVPENPPETFHEAVQSLWLLFAFQRLMGTWSGIGRIDAMLGPYLERDLADGRITLDQARELIAHFWIKGTEWKGCFSSPGSGDGQNYQNIILAGVDADGNEVANEVTYLVLDVVEELHISDFPIAVRVNRNTPTKLLERIAEVQRHGGGIVAIYNEEVVIEGLVKFGYELSEARTFTNDGCWEVLIPGRTHFGYSPFDVLQILQSTMGLKGDTPAAEFATYDDLYQAFHTNLAAHVEQFHRNADGYLNYPLPPNPLVSLFVEDCIERGRGYNERGARYNVLAPHAGGLANVANSLLVLRKLVFEEGYLSYPEFVAILKSDWEGQEPLRRLIQRRFHFYGNDSCESDRIMQQVFNDYTEMVAQVKQREGVLRPAGISTFGREIEWSHPHGGRTASPDGHHLGSVLATNFSPSPGTDLQGPTAVINSYCKMDFTRVPNGATVELKLHPVSVRGERGRDAMVALMRVFQQQGGLFLHCDVVDTALLIDAQRHPDKYPNLSVRIAGWSARFATLNKQWQDMIIARSEQRFS